MAVKKIMKMEQKPGVQQKWTLKETMCQDKMSMDIVEKIVQDKGQQNHQIKNSVSYFPIYSIYIQDKSFNSVERQAHVSIHFLSSIDSLRLFGKLLGNIKSQWWQREFLKRDIRIKLSQTQIKTCIKS